MYALPQPTSRVDSCLDVKEQGGKQANNNCVLVFYHVYMTMRIHTQRTNNLHHIPPCFFGFSRLPLSSGLRKSQKKPYNNQGRSEMGFLLILFIFFMKNPCIATITIISIGRGRVENEKKIRPMKVTTKKTEYMVKKGRKDSKQETNEVYRGQE